MTTTLLYIRGDSATSNDDATIACHYDHHTDHCRLMIHASLSPNE